MKALIFDVYGTLLHAPKRMGPIKRLLRTTEGSLSRKEALYALLTHPFQNPQEIVEFLSQTYQIEIPRYVQDEFFRNLSQEVSQVRPYPETLDVLQRLKKEGYKIGLISNVMFPFIAPIKSKGVEDLTDFRYYSCLEGHCKPEERVYTQTMNALGASPSETAMVGDSYTNDYFVPSRLGIRGIYLNRGSSENTDSTISSLDGLLTVIGYKPELVLR